MPEFSSSDVVAYILYKGSQENHRVSLTQTQKLLYCCYGIVMAKFNERLTDEHPKCWPFGPVFLNTLNDIGNTQSARGKDGDNGRNAEHNAQHYAENFP